MSGWDYGSLSATGVLDARAPSGQEPGRGDDLAERAELLAHRQATRRARLRRLATGAAGLAGSWASITPVALSGA